MFARRTLQLLFFFLFIASAVVLQGAEKREIEFRDKVDWKFGRPPTDAWSENDKAIVLRAFEKAKEIAPGVMARATAYRPIRMFRARQQKGFLFGHADTEFNGMYFYDLLLEERYRDSIPSTIIHECVHLIEGARGRDNEQWTGLVGESCSAVRKRVTDSGSKYFLTNTTSKARTLPRNFLQLPKEYGLPSLYACTNLAECLAECVEEMSRGRYDPPAELKAFIQQNYLSAEYEPTEPLRRFHEAIELYITKKYDKAITILSELIEETGNA